METPRWSILGALENTGLGCSFNQTMPGQSGRGDWGRGGGAMSRPRKRECVQVYTVSLTCVVDRSSEPS